MSIEEHVHTRLLIDGLLASAVLLNAVADWWWRTRSQRYVLVYYGGRESLAVLRERPPSELDQRRRGPRRRDWYSKR